MQMLASARLAANCKRQRLECISSPQLELSAVPSCRFTAALGSGLMGSRPQLPRPCAESGQIRRPSLGFFRQEEEKHKDLLSIAQYDWTTGAPDNGIEWRKYRVVPRSHPLRPLFCALFNRGGNRRAFRLPGEGGDHFHCTVEPSPGHIRCRYSFRSGHRFRAGGGGVSST